MKMEVENKKGLVINGECITGVGVNQSYFMTISIRGMLGQHLLKPATTENEIIWIVLWKGQGQGTVKDEDSVRWLEEGEEGTNKSCGAALP